MKEVRGKEERKERDGGGREGGAEKRREKEYAMLPQLFQLVRMH